jgi:hypothetical protein
VEQGTIVFGLRRYGCEARAHDLAGAMLDLARLYPEYRIPECVGGYARGERPTPAAYPQANTPQLWNATAFPLIVQSLLGLIPLAPYDLLAWRTPQGSSDYEVVSTRGTLRIVRQPPPEALNVTLWDRLTAFM